MSVTDLLARASPVYDYYTTDRKVLDDYKGAYNKYNKEYDACNWEDEILLNISMIDIYKEVVPQLDRTWIYNGDTGTYCTILFGLASLPFPRPRSSQRYNATSFLIICRSLREFRRNPSRRETNRH